MTTTVVSEPATLLATDANMPLILMAIEAADEISLDTETTGLNVRNGVDYLMGASFDTGTLSCYIPFRHRTDNVSRSWVAKLFDVIRTKDIDWHNRKFDMHSLKTLGIDPLQLVGKHYDSLMIAQLIDEELYSKQLDALAKKYLREQKEDYLKKFTEIYGWGAVPPHIMAPYACKDAQLHRRLKNVLWPKLLQQGLESVYWDTEAPFTTLLYKMEQIGVGVNQDLARQKAERGTLRMNTIKSKLHFNPASTKDLGQYLLDELGLPVLAYTPKGKPSFNKHAMEEYDEILQKSSNPSARLIAEYRGWQKAVSSLYLPLLNKVGPDGRIRTEFKQHGTVTGRLSASDPNLQQVPRGSDKPWNGDAKACFTSGQDGFTLIGWDYSQVELRLAAAYGQEEILLAEFAKDKADPFKVLTPLIFGSFSDELRHKTKNCLVYPSLYGAQLKRVTYELGMENEPEKAKGIYDRYKASISGITKVAEDVNKLMKIQKFIRYWDGRIRHIRDTDEAHKAWNSLLQGGAAQLVKRAMLECDKFCDNDCKIVLTVHDEITFIIRNEAIPDYEPNIVKAMTDWPDFGVKFAVEGKEWK